MYTSSEIDVGYWNTTACWTEVCLDASVICCRCLMRPVSAKFHRQQAKLLNRETRRNAIRWASRFETTQNPPDKHGHAHDSHMRSAVISCQQWCGAPEWRCPIKGEECQAGANYSPPTHFYHTTTTLLVRYRRRISLYNTQQDESTIQIPDTFLCCATTIFSRSSHTNKTQIYSIYIYTQICMIIFFFYMDAHFSIYKTCFCT